KFDYIYARELRGCIADNERLFRRAFEYLAPSGYLEIQAIYLCFLPDDDTAKLAKGAYPSTRYPNPLWRLAERPDTRGDRQARNHLGAAAHRLVYARHLLPRAWLGRDGDLGSYSQGEE
ncbi:hypothetical protein TOPH_09174, partial [Tolypocladium ophioglossoides CBS 100239]